MFLVVNGTKIFRKNLKYRVINWLDVWICYVSKGATEKKLLTKKKIVPKSKKKKLIIFLLVSNETN